MKLDIYYIENESYPDHMLHLFDKEGDTCYVEVLNRFDDMLHFPCERVTPKELNRFYKESTKALWDEWAYKNAIEGIKEAKEEIARYEKILAELNH